MPGADLFGPVPGELLGYRPRHRYLLIEIQSEDPASLPPDNVLAMKPGWTSTGAEGGVVAGTVEAIRVEGEEAMSTLRRRPDPVPERSLGSCEGRRPRNPTRSGVHY